MNIKKFLLSILCAIFVLSGHYSYSQDTEIKQKIQVWFDSLRVKPQISYDRLYPYAGKLRVKAVQFQHQAKTANLHFSENMAYIAFREDNIRALKDSLRKLFPSEYRKYTIRLYAGDTQVKYLIPNLYRQNIPIDKARIPDSIPGSGPPLVTSPDRPFTASKGLHNRHIALWHSHGWYYEQELDRWEFQRARLFQTIEDIYPMAYVLPYLVPMLENAGANVLLPRERDTQTNEVIVDNDRSTPRSVFTNDSPDSNWTRPDTAAFAIGHSPYTDTVNPFRQGTALMHPASPKGEAFVQWIPSIPEEGKYAVYVSYVSLPQSTEEANYTVYHSGGTTRFRINQQMGGRTWIYLGRFHFQPGFDPDKAAVVLTNRGDSGKVVTADAVRFGGGMGNISRNGKVSGRPRFLEAARYYLQYAGMPDTLVYRLNENNDYADDYQCRGEWVNYLIGSPHGPTDHRNVKGLDIPLDLSFAFHTDAGIQEHDSIIGTLAIFNTETDNGTFPNGTSRMACRDFADILQTEIVENIREKHFKDWQRRDLWNKKYSEAYRPTVPAVLLELLSHQNFRDMQFGLTPQFRFTVSRAIYKSMLKFLAYQYDTEYVVQPLPVDHFSAEVTPEGHIRLRWKPVADSLEPTSLPTGYVVYTKTGSSGYDNGRRVNDTTLLIENPEPGKRYSFYVTAYNKGGQSMPSEKLTVAVAENDRPRVLVINAFDRVAAPDTVDQTTFRGFANFRDEGVPDGKSLHYTGKQYEFDPRVPWKDDDDPGFGASYARWETTPIAGNTYDLVKYHVAAFAAIDRNVSAVSDEAVASGSVDLSQYNLVDIQFGEEKTTYLPGDDTTVHYRLWNNGLRRAVARYLEGNGKLIISGAYVGTDVFVHDSTKQVMEFAKKNLGYFHRTNHATTVGKVKPVLPYFSETGNIAFQDEFSSRMYKCEAPDAIEPEEDAKTFLRYRMNRTSAAVISSKRGTAVLGFPIETIKSPEKRNLLIKRIVKYLHETE